MASLSHTVTLTPEQSLCVDDMIADGRFSSPQEAVAYSIEVAARETTSLTQYSPATLAHLDRAMAEVKRGDFVSQEEVEAFFEEWRNEP